MQYSQLENSDYNQYWFYISTPPYTLFTSDKTTKESPGKEMTKRIVGISTPKVLVHSKKYKYILNTDFNIDGMASEWDCGTDGFPGWGGIITGKCASDKKYLMKNIMDLFKKFIAEDYIIVHLSLSSIDCYYNIPIPDNVKDPSVIKDPNNVYWYPDNPDQQYLERLFNVIYKNKFPGELSGLKLSYDDLSLFGYSVGAGAVSRYMNEFPSMQTKPGGYKFPIIKSTTMVGGGSLYCYSKVFKGCFDSVSPLRGCCPKDLSEPNFDNGKIPWSKHPPVILIQSTDDAYADPMASTYYYNIMVKNNVPCKKVINESRIHGISSDNQIDAIVDWVKKYTSKTDKTKHNKHNKDMNLKIASLLISLMIVVVLFIFLASGYEKNHRKTIIFGIFLFISALFLIILLFLCIKNTHKKIKSSSNTQNNTQNNTKKVSTVSPDSLDIISQQLLAIGKQPFLTVGQLFDKVVEIKDQIYSDYPEIGGVLVHMVPLEKLEACLNKKHPFEFNLSSESPGFIADCSLDGQSKQNCSAWTYLRKDLPPIVFSYPSSDVHGALGDWNQTIGIIVDPSLLWPMITTMSIIDSDTDARNCGSQILNVFDVTNNDNNNDIGGRCDPKVYTTNGKQIENPEHCIFQSTTTLTGCKTVCSYEKDIVNTNCRMKNSGASMNSYLWKDDDYPGFSWDCPNEAYRNWTDKNFPNGVESCYKSVEIDWEDISEDDKNALNTIKYGKNQNYCQKWAKFVPSEDCYATAPMLYQTESIPNEGSTTGILIEGTNLEVTYPGVNNRNYMYVGEEIDSVSVNNTSTFSQQTWENCDFSSGPLATKCKAGKHNIPISASNVCVRQAKWIKKDWGRWIDELNKFWKYTYSTMDKDGYKNKTALLDGDGGYYNSYDYNFIYGNPCNMQNWLENEVNIYINQEMAADENSDLNKLFRRSMLGVCYVGKSCEDFVSDLPTGTNIGKGCKFSNGKERCVGYLCTTDNIDRSNPDESVCDDNKTKYHQVRQEELKRIEKSKKLVISFVEKFNAKYRVGIPGIVGYKLMSSSNAFPSFVSLDKLFRGKLTSADVFIPI